MKMFAQLTLAWMTLAGLSGAAVRTTEPPTSAPLPRASEAARMAAPSTPTLELARDARTIQYAFLGARQNLIATDARVSTYVVTLRLAEDAYRKKLRELADASTESARIRTDAVTLRAQITSTALPLEKRRELARRNRDLVIRSRMIEKRIESAPELAKLAAEVQQAGARLDDRVMQLLKSDARTSPIATSFDQLKKLSLTAAETSATAAATTATAILPPRFVKSPGRAPATPAATTQPLAAPPVKPVANPPK